MPVPLKADNVRFAYRRSARPSLTGIDTTFEPGGFTALMGRSGCGKSTLCLALTGLIPRNIRGQLDGTIRLGDQSVGDLTADDIAREMGIVFQDFEGQLFATSVVLELAFGMENLGLTRTEMRHRIAHYLSLLRLDAVRDQEPSTLSGGQKQRLALAAALILEPGILVLDEPTSDLDTVSRDEVLRVARRVGDRPRSLIVVEHDAEAVLGEEGDGADRVLLMDDGAIVADGPAGDIFRDPTLLRDHGVRPTQIADLCHRLGLPEIALTVAEALGHLDTRGRRGTTAAMPRTDAPSGPAVASARQVSHSYPRRAAPALSGVSLTVHSGEFVAIVGQNGSGKTTLAKALSGLLKPTDGEVLLDGRPTHTYTRADLARRVGYIFQNPDHQLFSGTVREEVSFGPRNFGLNPDVVAERVTWALGSVDLRGVEDQDPFILGKGDRQRLAIASVLAMEPSVLVLDEPTAGLDHVQQRMVMDMLRRLNQAGRTVAMVTHNMPIVAEYATRTVVMRGGRIILDGPTTEVFRREDVLTDASVRPPPVVRLSNRLGIGALTVTQLAGVLGSGR